jgi:hypothetical protein
MSKNKENISGALAVLKENYTPIEVSNFMKVVKQQPLHAIFENAGSIYSEPTQGHRFILNVLKTSEIETDALIALKEGMSSYHSKAVAGGYKNQEHLDGISESLSVINAELNRRNSTEYLREETIYKLHQQFLPHSTLLEGNMSDSLDNIVLNIGDTPSLAVTYAAVLGDITSIDDFLRSDPGVVLIKNTSMILNVNKDAHIQKLGQEYLQSIINLPLRMVESVENGECKIAVAESLKAIIHKQLQRVFIALEQCEGNLIVIDAYEKVLQAAHEKFDKIIDSKYTVMQESATEYVAPFSEGIVDDGLDFSEEELELDDMFEPIDATEVEKGELSPLEEMFDKVSLEQSFAIHFVNTFMDDTDTINLESFNKMIQVAHRYDITMEAGMIRDGARRVALAGEKITRGFVHGVRRNQTANKRVTAVAKRIPKHIDGLVDKTIGSLVKMDRDERRKRIIEGGYKTRLFKLIRTGILVGGTAALVNPALAAIGLIALVANDKRLDRKVRTRIVDEMDSELRIVNEKIDDAKSANDKQKKYQLMRIRDKLEKDIVRIRYNIRDMEG